MFFRLLALAAAMALPLSAAPEEPQKPDAIARQILAPLLDPVKVPTQQSLGTGTPVDATKTPKGLSGSDCSGICEDMSVSGMPANIIRPLKSK